MAYDISSSLLSLGETIRSIRDSYTTIPHRPLSGACLNTTLLSTFGIGQAPHITNFKSPVIDSDLTNMSHNILKMHVKILYMISKKGYHGLCFETVDFGQPIDEKKLISIIDILDSWKNPDANLISPLLLEGRIPNQVERKDKPEAYWEKRIHDAITLYGKVAKNKTLKPLVEFLLWEIRTTSPVESIQARLNQYDLIPPLDYIPTWREFNAPRKFVNLRDIRRTLFFKPELIEGTTNNNHIEPSGFAMS